MMSGITVQISYGDLTGFPVQIAYFQTEQFCIEFNGFFKILGDNYEMAGAHRPSFETFYIARRSEIFSIANFWSEINLNWHSFRIQCLYQSQHSSSFGLFRGAVLYLSATLFKLFCNLLQFTLTAYLP